MSDIGLKLRTIEEIRLGQPIQDPHDANKIAIPMYLQLERNESDHQNRLSLLLPDSVAVELRKEIASRFAPALDTSLGQSIQYTLGRIEGKLLEIEEKLEEIENQKD